MGRWAALVAVVGCCWIMWRRPQAPSPPPPPSPQILQVRGLQLVDHDGAVIGGFMPTAAGVELVVGGPSQISLVTDASGAHVNLVGPNAVVRVHATDADGPVPALYEALQRWADDDVRPPEPAHGAPHRDAAPSGLDPPR